MNPETKTKMSSVWGLISRVLSMFLLALQATAQASERKLVVDPSTYTTKTISENFMSNPVSYFIMIWMIVHTLLGILFFCFLASERSMMKPTSITL
ncbi:putative transmembrane protein [Cryptosporidium felis]|nr:putative transmembrane protein [Cryptosporidium felis]